MNSMRACARGLGEASRIIWCNRKTRLTDSRKLSIVVSIAAAASELESFWRCQRRRPDICHRDTVTRVAMAATLSLIIMGLSRHNIHDYQHVILMLIHPTCEWEAYGKRLDHPRRCRCALILRGN